MDDLQECADIKTGVHKESSAIVQAQFEVSGIRYIRLELQPQLSSKLVVFFLLKAIIVIFLFIIRVVLFAI